MGKQNKAKREKRLKNAVSANERATRRWRKERQRPETKDKTAAKAPNQETDS